MSNKNKKAENLRKVEKLNQMNKKNMPKIVKIGSCPVDSGQLIIIDPCYLKDWKDGEFNDKEKENPTNHYSKCCVETLKDGGAGEVLVSDIAGNGVAFASGYGDGCYPILAHYNKEGRIIKVEIIME